MEKISVLMCIYKEPKELIEKAIVSILNQTYKNLEIIVIVDDPTNALGIEILNDIANKDERVRIYINEHNMGLPKSLNRALGYASGNYIARMDADDISLPRRLELEIEFLKKYNLDLVASGVIKIDIEENTLGEDRVCLSPKKIKSILKYTDILPHPTWLVKKELYNKLSGYREIFSCEDYDFLLRARRSGAKFGIVPYLLLMYRINTDGISKNNTLRQTLSTHYLSNNYRRIERVTPIELEQYVIKNMSLEAAKEYNIHSERLMKIAQTSHKNIRDVFSILNSLIVCKFIRYNYKQILIKKLYNLCEIKRFSLDSNDK